MQIGTVICLVNVILWWLMFSRAPKLGYKILFCVLAVCNSWLFMERLGIFTTGFDRQTLTKTVDQVQSATPKLHAPKL